MYQEHFGLNSKPFGIVPDTRFLFLSDSHKEAIAHLLYALNEKNGFVQLTGEVGVGKTMACRYILNNIPDDINVALILNPRISERSLLRTLCQELNISFSVHQPSNELSQLINRKLLTAHAAGRHTILIIDEAQNLPKRTLEQIRLLTNLETDTQKLLRIILIGQPELAELLAEHDMRQVAQRITSRYHLGTLERHETDAYIRHRLKIAGCERRLFSKTATRKIHKLTDGTPRLINLLCDRALIGAYSMGVHEVTPNIVKIAAKEALPLMRSEPERLWPRWMPSLAVILVLTTLATLYQDKWRGWLNQNWPQLSAAIPTLDSLQSLTTPSKPDAETKVPEQEEVTKTEEKKTQRGTEAEEKVQMVMDQQDLRPETSDDATVPAEPVLQPQAKKTTDQFKQYADLDFRLGIPPKKE